MTKRILDEQKIIDIIWGATLMGGGGGGSMKDGLSILKKFKDDHPAQTVQVELIDPDDMSPGSVAAVTAGMGAPTAIAGIDFSKYAVNAFNALKEMGQKMSPPVNLSYSMAVEMGGFNTFVPMLISLVNNIPFIDSDGAARAVPALNTLLLHVNGLNTSPLAMANGDNDKLTIALDNPKNAELAEEIGRHICMAFGMLSGLSGWMLTGDQIKENLPAGSITTAADIGAILRANVGGTSSALDVLRSKGVLCKKLCENAQVIAAENKQAHGFDYGVVTIQAGSDTYKIFFQNENLLVDKNDAHVMTVPDIISVIDRTTGQPLTNADVKEGMSVDLGVIKVDNSWWKMGEPFVKNIWKTFFNTIGYDGDLIKYVH